LSPPAPPEDEGTGPRRPEALTGEETRRFAGLLEAVEGADDLLVVTHDNPDPDALASAAALGFLLGRSSGVACSLAFGGIVGRAENKALIDEIGAEFRRLGRDVEISSQTAVALVDTQPRAGNNSLPAGRIASVVIDHHPLRPETAASPFADVRPEYGACCSIVVEYLRAAGLEPERPLATALFYGIQSETADLGREVSPADISASLYLYPRTDPEAYARIRHPRLPTSYFRSVHQALEEAHCYGRVIVASAGRLTHPDMVAELADLLVRARGVDWSIALGTYGSSLLISVRSAERVAHAGELVRGVVGDRGSAGGHGMLAGGQVDIQGLSEDEADELTASIVRDFLEALGAAEETPVSLIGK
jgi:nanoRNase/pAp phosphatase (c-di-AMP/oligoRNAs hydrolase)